MVAPTGGSAGHTLVLKGAALGTLLLFGCVGDADDEPRGAEAHAALDGLRCSAEVRTLLEDSGGYLEPMAAPPTGSGGRVLRFRSEELGRWYVVTQEPTGALAAVERSPRGDRAWTFGDRCEATPRRPEVGPSPARVVGENAPVFGDEELAAAIEAAAPDPVVVYFWSPHMPLAVDGVAEILEAGEASRAHVEVVLIEHADPAFAVREAERVGMPRSALRVAASIELLMRDGPLHAPSILVFSTDRVSPVLPGYRNAEGYASFIDAFKTSATAR